ncbi:MAG: hypothetical protein ABW034_17680 [Steroidobacteraceae bacterium]
MSVQAPFRLLSCALLSLLYSTQSIAQPADLALKFDRPQLAQGEPVVALVSVQNRSTAPIEIPHLFDPTYGTYQYWVRSPDGRLRHFDPGWIAELDRAQATAVNPGSSISGFARLFHASNGTPFREPGAYKVSVSSGNLKSAEVSLSIKAPATAHEREAAELLMDPDVTLFLLAQGGETLKNARPNLEKITSTYADTALAPYASYALGVYFSKDSRDFVHKNVRPADLPQSQTLLEPVTRAPVSPYFRFNAYQKLVDVALARGDKARADAYLRELQTKSAKDPEAARVIQDMSRAIQAAPSAGAAR